MVHLHILRSWDLLFLNEHVRFSLTSRTVSQSNQKKKQRKEEIEKKRRRKMAYRTLRASSKDVTRTRAL